VPLQAENLYWNNKFQTLLAQRDSAKKFTELTRLAKDFVRVAETYGRIIITENFLPPEKMTIRPAEVGGTAGGRKYIYRGILFKFAIDQKVSADPKGRYLYSGTGVPNHEGAIKAAHNEMKGNS